MMQPFIYLDNHATTRVDPRVVDAMLPWFSDSFANAGSSTHEAGRSVKEAVDNALGSIADYFGADSDELIVTSGATESNNLAIFGIANHPRQKRKKIISVVTEHQATLGPLAKLKSQGFEIILLPVLQHSGQFQEPKSPEIEKPFNEPEGTHNVASNSRCIGEIDLSELELLLDEDVALVTIMLANNEIGVIQPISKIAELCQRYDIPLHTDATQAVGRLPSTLKDLGANLVSFSAHKFYGPKGIGGLLVHRTGSPIRLAPQIVGGGQQQNLRSGTLNSAGIMAMAAAFDCLRSDQQQDNLRAFELRQRLWDRLKSAIPELKLNGPTWDVSEIMNANVLPNPKAPGLMEPIQAMPKRLSNNLNVCFPKVDGQSLMLEASKLAVSSGSACTSAHPEPSHVLRAIGRSEDQARSSIRFGIGRFNTEPEIDEAVDLLVTAYRKLESFVA